MSTASDARQLMAGTTYAPALPSVGGVPDVPTSAPTMTPGDIWRVIKQRKWLIGVTAVLVYMLVVVGTFLMLRYAPAYYSEAFVQLVPPTEGYQISERTNLTDEYIQRELATEASRMKEPQVLMDVLALPDVKELSFYKWYGDNFERCLRDLRETLSVAPIRDTYLIRVGIALKNPSDATTIVNRLVERHIARSRDTLSDEGRRRLDNLRNTKSALEKELNDLRQRIAARRAQRDMPALESDRIIQSDVVSTLSNTLAELETREADLETQLLTIRGQDPRNLPVSAEMRIIIEADPVLRYYRQQVEQLDIQIDSQVSTLMGRNHRQIQLLQSNRDHYFAQEAARRDELTDDLRSRQFENLQQEIARIRTMKLTISEQLSERENSLRDLDQAVQELTAWQDDEQRLGRQLEQVEGALRENETMTNSRNREGRLSVASLARNATSPSRPNLIVFLGGGAVLALLSGFGLAFLREFTDQRIRTPIDVSRYGHLSVLGSIPELDDDEVDMPEIEQATRKAPQSVTAEAFRQIRAHLMFSGPRESQRVLLITSPRPGDGKTAVAVNLAVAFAQGNESVLLIDCNFRRPAVRKAFPGAKSDGLSNVLVGRAAFDAVVSKSDVPTLDVLTSGPMPPNPGELLGSTMMRELLETARKRYDRVIIDGPPCLLISDALVIACQAEGVIVVARAVNGTKGTLRRAREQLSRMGARVIGAVLNGVKVRAGGYLRQQYREFYDYTDEEVVVRELPEARDALAMLEGKDKDEPKR